MALLCEFWESVRAKTDRRRENARSRVRGVFGDCGGGILAVLVSAVDMASLVNGDLDRLLLEVFDLPASIDVSIGGGRLLKLTGAWSSFSW